jgi:hypothetical protein
MFVRTPRCRWRRAASTPEQAVVGPRTDQPPGRPAARAPTPTCWASSRSTARRSRRPSSCSRSGWRSYTPEWAAGITGIPAETIRRLAHEMGITARDEKIELPIAWTDVWGNEHDTVTGNPVAFHAMRGLAAHSNGFQTIRALSILMTLLGTIDRPGGFRHKAPFPRPIPPCAKPPNGRRRAAEHAARRHAAGLAGGPRRPVRRRRRQSRCASTRPSPGSTRCRCTA